ncbi:MAG TPA: mannose-1-phosphate guanylyltransferase/mannose-6-phosphate isomerase [Sulfurimonas autotrophica]|nr:mannose-1-phosphate guanylyltransferase/mannose-6-phosphate isomerase [Sulfurimonas autotrophica]
MTNIILCGGSGTRLWPLSRTLMPKQFVKLFDNKSLFQITVERNAQVCEKQLIVSNTEQYFLALDQIEEISSPNSKYLLEPVGRNTAPAIALACFSLDADEVVLVTPSDHLIKDEAAYVKVVEKAKEFAKDNKLVTFGIKPAFPEIGFGYIEADEFNVKAFHEKPDLDRAKSYLEKGNYYWNSGMFCFKAGVFLEELKKYAPEIYNMSLLAYKNSSKDEMIRIRHDDMLKIPDNSIDYAVMEKSKLVKIVPSDIEWSDLGSFDALAKELPNDENNNLIISDKVVELIDIKDTIVVDTGDALLVAKKGNTQKVKEIVSRLKEEGSELTNVHLTGHRPWGNYTILDEDNGYKIKRIVVQSGKRLSLQKHYHRNEHWIVLSGSATVTVNEKVFMVNPNESTYIKAGDVHRLENQGKLPLCIIEVQVGEYTGEDDIVRLEDDFRRAENE